MCGILGVDWRDGAPVPREQVAGLTALLDHRGPDDRGVAAAGRVCFGHTRLAIIATGREEARQPVSRDGCLLTYNGEIYNFRDLVEALRREGIACSGLSDTETLFLCLRHWGVARTLDAVDGMFAFAYHEDRTGTTTLARDRVGEKPLYWSLAAGRLWFASEIKALLAGGDVSAEPNLARIDDFLFTARINGEDTFFREVRELEPGTMLEYGPAGGAPAIRAYWQLEEHLPTGPDAAVDDALRGDFLDRAAGAVGSRRISDVPVGVLLSGGIDSNTLTDLLLTATPDDTLDLFFADNADPAVSERTDVDAFLDGARQRHPEATLRLHSGILDFDDYQQRFRRLTWHYDEPIQFTNTPLLGGLCARARGTGVKVLFSGEGSDELLYGYDRFERTRRQLDGVDDRQAILSALYFGGGQHSADLVRRLTAGVAQGPEATAPWRWLERHVGRLPLDLLQMIFSQKFRLQMLLQRQDRVGMSESIEIRVPFLAPAFVAWVNRLPMAAKRHPETGNGKRILREVMRGRLPARILEKPKDGFPADMNWWLQGTDMARLVRELVEDPAGFCRSYLDGGLARQIVADHFSGNARRDVLIWNLFSLEIWHRVFGRGAAQSRIAAAS